MVDAFVGSPEIGYLLALKRVMTVALVAAGARDRIVRKNGRHGTRPRLRYCAPQMRSNHDHRVGGFCRRRMARAFRHGADSLGSPKWQVGCYFE